MSSKHNSNLASRQAAQNQLRRLNAMDPFLAIGNLSSLNPENRVQGPPLSAAYLQQYGPPSYASNSNPPPLPHRDGYRNRPGYSGMNTYSGLGGYSGMGYSGMNSYYSPFSSRRYSPGLYSSSMYSPYSSYRNSYGPYGASIGPYGASNDEYNNFVQMAEESTRPAFESIESFVQVVHSIGMMLDSTYGAIHSSYSAIIGVISQFSYLKTHLAEIFSILTMLKGLRWLCLKVLYLLGLRKINPSVENAWKTASKAVETGEFPPEAKGSAWPFFMFLSIVIGAPWLMFKLLSKSVAKKPLDPRIWVTTRGQQYVALGAYDFTATQPNELSFSKGEKLTLLPKDVKARRNWIFARNQQNETGLVPVNYLNLNASQKTRSIVSTQNANVSVPLPSMTSVGQQFMQKYSTGDLPTISAADTIQGIPVDIPSKAFDNVDEGVDSGNQSSANPNEILSDNDNQLPTNVDRIEKDTSSVDLNLTQGSEFPKNESDQ